MVVMMTSAIYLDSEAFLSPLLTVLCLVVVSVPLSSCYGNTYSHQGHL